MKEEPKQDEALRRYVLGRLGEAEIERVEHELFASDDLLERLLAIEDEMIDDYASGRLDPGDRTRFERYLLQTKEDRERVEFASTLSTFVARGAHAPWRDGRVTETAPVSLLSRVARPWVAISLAASLLLAAGALWSTLEMRRLDDELERTRAATSERERTLEGLLTDERRQRQELDRRLAEERERARRLETEDARERSEAEQRGLQAARQPSPSVLAFVLRTGGVRSGGDVARLSVTPWIREVRLEAVLPPNEYTRFRVELQTIDGEVIWSRSGLRSHDRRDERLVSTNVPATVFRRTDYILGVLGASPSGVDTPVAEYFFRVE